MHADTQSGPTNTSLQRAGQWLQVSGMQGEATACLFERPSVQIFPILVCLVTPALTVLNTFSSARTPPPTLTSPLSGRAANCVTWTRDLHIQ